MADNEDVYGPNGVLDPGEDVQQTGVLVKDTSELPDPAALSGSYGTDRIKRAVAVAAWTNPNNYFRRSVRLFNGENLQVTGAAGKLSPTLGITVSTENPIYIWGNYNTTGINAAQPIITTVIRCPPRLSPMPSSLCRKRGSTVPVPSIPTPAQSAWPI
jgi:hypothetical protein